MDFSDGHPHSSVRGDDAKTVKNVLSTFRHDDEAAAPEAAGGGKGGLRWAAVEFAEWRDSLTATRDDLTIQMSGLKTRELAAKRNKNVRQLQRRASSKKKDEMEEDGDIANFVLRIEGKVMNIRFNLMNSQSKMMDLVLRMMNFVKLLIEGRASDCKGPARQHF